jgi:hypothetical protein
VSSQDSFENQTVKVEGVFETSTIVLDEPPKTAELSLSRIVTTWKQ